MSSSKAPINSLEDIARRKQQLRAKIEVQERRLSKDLDAYQDDVDTFKKVWDGLKGIRHFGQNFSLSGISNAVQAVRARVEGLAALAKRPKAIMAGQIAYTASLFAVCSILLPLGVPGWAMAVTAIFVAPICVTATIYAALARGGKPREGRV